MAALSQEQINKFWDDGVLVVDGAVSAKELAERDDLARAVFLGAEGG